ncbi:MAG: hypothetical protein ACYDCC_15345 [Actinomycetota bacterium]
MSSGLGMLAAGFLILGAACTYRPVVASDQTPTPATTSSPIPPRRLTQVTGAFVAAGFVDPSFIWSLTTTSLEVSHDAGAHWSSITPPQATSSFSLRSALFVNREIWLAASPISYGSTTHTLVVFRSSSQGATWSSSTVNLPSCGAGSDAVSFSFLPDGHGWMSVDQGSHSGFAYGSVLATTDGGVTWSAGTCVQASGPVRFFDDKTGFLIGGVAGAMFGTIDGGLHWRQMFRTRRPGINYELPVAFDGTWILPIWYEGTGGEIDISTNQGKSWGLVPNSIHVMSKADPLATDVLSATHWIVPSGDGLLVTTDQGTWTRIASKGLGQPVYTLQFATDSDGIAITGNGPKLLELTSDGGRSWKIIRTYAQA